MERERGWAQSVLMDLSWRVEGVFYFGDTQEVEQIKLEWWQWLHTRTLAWLVLSNGDQLWPVPLLDAVLKIYKPAHGDSGTWQGLLNTQARALAGGMAETAQTWQKCVCMCVCLGGVLLVASCLWWWKIDLKSMFRKSLHLHLPWQNRSLFFTNENTHCQ